ncbi:exocyst complex component 7 isoform X2 [Ctenocephalides felis]|uniref:exocyst complex component 7 isoform X2 n=1 Tax=Ctenocephalides felis TaxID=7515 RepID=UPI000E6E3BA0|nr:exocyst complex component 7 isoform X2 [Ctenocephalides felis]
MLIERKLEKEKANLSLLRERVQRSKVLTSSIVDILESFEQRLAKLEHTILPVYTETGYLQQRQQNIDASLQCLQHVMSYYSAPQTVCDLINLGPDKTGLQEYLRALNKLSEAKEYFQHNNPQSVELQNTSLFPIGCDLLSKYFHDILVRHNRHVKPVEILDLISLEEDLKCLPSFLTLIPETSCQDLNLIAQWLAGHSILHFLQIYIKERSAVFLKSLQLLKDNHKTSSWNQSPLLRNKYSKSEGSSRRARIQQIFEKKANRMLMKASQTLEMSTGFTIGLKKASSFGEDDAHESDMELERYLVEVAALHKLLQAEHCLLLQIIPAPWQSNVFQMIAKKAVEVIVSDGENITSRARKSIGQQDFGAVLMVFPMLRHLLAMQPDLQKTVENCESHVADKLMSIFTMMHDTISKALEDFIESVKSETSSQLPKDATVHELTNNVLVFLEQLMDYVDIIGGVLEKDASYNNALSVIVHNKQNITYDKNKALLGVYIKKVLVQLNLTLLSKSEVYTDSCTKFIFRVNNNHYMLKSLQRSGLIEFLRIAEPSCEHNYYDMIQEHKKKYLSSWNKLLSSIITLDETLFAGKLRDKDRAVLKERFSAFNKEFEDMSRVQRGISIPDLELREGIKRDNKELLLPKYNTFYDLYANVKFTKNVEKYVKFTPAQVAIALDRFFDDSV